MLICCIRLLCDWWFRLYHHITNICYFVAFYLFSLWYDWFLWRCFVLLFGEILIIIVSLCTSSLLKYTLSFPSSNYRKCNNFFLFLDGSVGKPYPLQRVKVSFPKKRDILCLTASSEEVSVLEVWGVWRTPSWLLLPGSLWPGLTFCDHHHFVWLTLHIYKKEWEIYSYQQYIYIYLFKKQEIYKKLFHILLKEMKN